MTLKLLEDDGLTLRPVPERYRRTAVGLCEFVAALRLELLEGEHYLNSSIPVLIHLLRDAAERGSLRPVDCRSLMDSGLQVVRMFHEIFPERLGWMQTRFLDGGGLEDKGIVDCINAEKINYPLMSRVLDFFLFCIESRQPSINLLSTERIPYEMVPWFPAKGGTAQSLPLQSSSLLRWRVKLRQDEAFSLWEQGILEEYAKLGHWVFMAPFDKLKKGLLFASPDNTLKELRRVDSDSRTEVLSGVCTRFRLEMIGTFGKLPWRHTAFHFLPHRVHVFKHADAVSVSIPDFFTFDMIQSSREAEFWGLSLGLKGGEKVPNKIKLYEDEELRKVGVAIRQSLLKWDSSSNAHSGGENSVEKRARKARSLNYARAVVEVIWGHIPKDPTKILGTDWQTKSKKLKKPTLDEAIESANDAVVRFVTKKTLLRTWSDLLFELSLKGVWNPSGE